MARVAQGGPDIVTTTVAPVIPSQQAFPGYGQTTDVGANWRIKFADADGIPLNMVSFEVIDFGAIAYKEIFQNVKTILATPLYSAALERLLGIDQTIVDLPIGQSAQAVVAILDALYFWEPRVEVVNIGFSADALAGHLICNLQLKIKNVIYGTDQPYNRNNIFDTPPRVTQALPPHLQPPSIVPPVEHPVPPPVVLPYPIPGPPGPTGARGSYWFTDVVDPSAATLPFPPQSLDMFLNSATGDVFQFDGATWTKKER